MGTVNIWRIAVSVSSDHVSLATTAVDMSKCTSTLGTFQCYTENRFCNVCLVECCIYSLKPWLYLLDNPRLNKYRTLDFISGKSGKLRLHASINVDDNNSLPRSYTPPTR